MSKSIELVNTGGSIRMSVKTSPDGKLMIAVHCDTNKGGVAMYAGGDIKEDLVSVGVLLTDDEARELLDVLDDFLCRLCSADEGDYQW
jgi:hypothetical protein